MPVTRRDTLCLGVAAFALPAIARAAPAIRITPMVEGLSEPWALAFLPDGRILITERAGRLRVFADGTGSEISGLPEVAATGQGGLLDVMVPRDFARSGRLWFSYAHPGAGGASTALGHAVLAGGRLEGFTRVHDGPSVRRHGQGVVRLLGPGAARAARAARGLRAAPRPGAPPDEPARESPQ